MRPQEARVRQFNHFLRLSKGVKTCETSSEVRLGKRGKKALASTVLVITVLHWPTTILQPLAPKSKIYVGTALYALHYIKSSCITYVENNGHFFRMITVQPCLAKSIDHGGLIAGRLVFDLTRPM